MKRTSGLERTFGLEGTFGLERTFGFERPFGLERMLGLEFGLGNQPLIYVSPLLRAQHVQLHISVHFGHTKVAAKVMFGYLQIKLN